jgi:uncharacterized protein involved in exopolysaccharide biosynthesis
VPIEKTEAELQEEEAIAAVAPAEAARFVLGAGRRRRKLTIFLYLIFGGAGLGAAILLPPRYVSEVKLVTRPNLVVGALGHQNRPNHEVELPTKTIQDVLKRDNLLALIKEGDLMTTWSQERTLAGRYKDRVMIKLKGPPTDEDMVAVLVGTLEKKLYISADETSITIGAEWHTAQTAHQLVELIQKNFLESKYNAEDAMISEAIHIMENQAKREQESMNLALQELQKLEEQKLAGKTAEPSNAPDAGAVAAAHSASPPPVPAARPRPSGGIEDADLRRMIEEKRRTIAALEDAREKQLTASKTKLAELEGTLAPAHPQVIAMRRQIEMLSSPSPELVEARAEEQALVARLQGQSAVRYSGMPSPAPVAAVDAGAPLVIVTDNRDDAATELARSRLTNATLKFNEISARIETARVEREFAREGFKYRYTVFKPAEVPKKPSGPNRIVIGLGGLLGGLALALGIAALLDLLKGRIIEPWQARRATKLQVLGEVRLTETTRR